MESYLRQSMVENIKIQKDKLIATLTSIFSTEIASLLSANKEVVSIALHLSSGCSGFGLSANTLGSNTISQENLTTLENYYLYSVDEWSIIYLNYDSFSELNEKNDSFLDELYDMGLSDEEIFEIYEDISTKVLIEIKNVFDRVIFFCVQFSDASVDELNMMKTVHSRLYEYEFLGFVRFIDEQLK